jgi:ABC-type spermidine/putrescine transport system permease subunit II
VFEAEACSRSRTTRPTYFSIGANQTFTIFIANKVRQGVTPAVNAVAFVIVAAAVHESGENQRARPDAAGDVLS